MWCGSCDYAQDDGVGVVAQDDEVSQTTTMVPMRVISGRFKSLSLPSAPSSTRPTTDRTKEAIFSRLEAQGVLTNARVLDLFAGTGALGIEALSRGANALIAVESSHAAVAAIRRTLSELSSRDEWGSDMAANVIKQRVESFVNHYDGFPFDVVFADPPYDLDTAVCDKIMRDLVERDLVNGGGVIVFERSARSDDLTPPQGWSVDDVRTYGETKVWYVASEVFRR